MAEIVLGKGLEEFDDALKVGFPRHENTVCFIACYSQFCFLICCENGNRTCSQHQTATL